MAYTALYRKYRPSEFGDVKGQDHIVTTLKNQIRADRIGHAYLFCGTRGTGKTTVAKIFAQAVNCENPVDGSPCGECPVCRSIASGSSMDVQEIDAASNNSVDNVRKIREEVTYSPSEGRYKVYIIDEVHMLSPGAFNALLKTLEEPPSYVIFILATTEAHKIPVTILSRCQRYDFRRISTDTIAARLKDLLDSEGIRAEEKAIRYIAKAGDGSLRDAISLTDQCIAFYLGEDLTYDHVLEVLGAVDTGVFSRLFRGILKQDVAGIMSLLEEMVIRGRDLSQFVSDFIWYLRNLLLLQSTDGMEDVLDMSGDNMEQLKEEALLVEEDVLMRYIRVLSELTGALRYSQQKRVLIEIALIKLCHPSMENRQDALTDRVAVLERKIEQGVPVIMTTEAGSGKTERPAPVKEKPQLPAALPEDIRKVVSNWNSIVQASPGLSKGYLRSALVSLNAENQLLLVFEEGMAAAYMSDAAHLKDLQNVIAAQIGKTVDIVIRENDTGRPANETYPDLNRINFDIEITDED